MAPTAIYTQKETLGSNKTTFSFLPSQNLTLYERKETRILYKWFYKGKKKLIDLYPETFI